MNSMKELGFDDFITVSSADSKITSMIHAFRCKDSQSCFHLERVAVLACKLAKAFGCLTFEIERIGIAALLHDIGKLEIADEILFKKGSLTDKERHLIEKHPMIGYQMIQTMLGDDRIASIVLEHHERFDGSGYPKGVGGANISLEARIIAICDAYDAMNSHRSYAKPMTHESSIHELIINKGTQFDPNLVDLFIAMIRYEET